MTFPLQLSFELYLDDDRYAVPTLHLIFADDRAGALKIAGNFLEASKHHRGGELCQDGEHVARLGGFTERRAPPAWQQQAGAGD